MVSVGYPLESRNGKRRSRDYRPRGALPSPALRMRGSGGGCTLTWQVRGRATSQGRQGGRSGKDDAVLLLEDLGLARTERRSTKWDNVQARPLSLRQYSSAIALARTQKMRDQLWQALLLNLVRDFVPHRPGRYEPRAVKHRPKPFALLNKPRRRYREVCHRSKYSKSHPRNLRAIN